MGQANSKSLLPSQQYHRENHPSRIRMDCEKDGRGNGSVNLLKLKKQTLLQNALPNFYFNQLQ